MSDLTKKAGQIPSHHISSIKGILDRLYAFKAFLGLTIDLLFLPGRFRAYFCFLILDLLQKHSSCT